MTPHASAEPTTAQVAPPAAGELLAAVLDGRCLSAVVPRALDVAERDPLTSARWFPGDLVRGLMEVPGGFWGRHPRLYLRYQSVLRANAAARRRLPPEQRMAFWQPLSDLARGGAP